jgi:branched-chain amino acid transport system substrate-binding protein
MTTHRNLPASALTRRSVLTLMAAGASIGPTAVLAQQEPVKLGSVLSLTGPGAGIGQPERNGILLAERLINAGGGIGGRPLKVLIEDDGSKPDLAKSKAEGLIFGENAVAIVGPTLTASTGAIAAITNGEKMAQVSFTGLGPAIEQSYKMLYHALPAQSLNARAMLEYATKSAKVKKIGVLHDTGYGQAVMGALQAVSTSYGVEYVGVERFEVGATDVSAQAAKIRAANPEIVFVIATSPVPFRNARQMKISQQIVSAIGSASYEYVQGIGEFADDIVFPEFLVAEAPLPRQAAFVEEYRKAYNTLPKNFEAAGYDAVHMLARAIAKAGPKASREAVALAMREPYEGVLAKYDFSAPDMTGIQLPSFVYSQLVKGKFTRLPFTVG